jgi:hypothetical protein
VPPSSRSWTALALVLSAATCAVVALGAAGPAAAAESAPVVARLTAGNTGVADAAGSRWTPDRRALGAGGPRPWRQPAEGVLRRSTAPIAGTTDDALYQRERVGLRGYRLRVPAAGTYRVSLHQAELEATGPGQRVFDVLAEGRTVVAALDVFARVGRHHALVVPFDVTVTDGVLDLVFVPRAGATKVAAVSVVPQPQAAPGVPSSARFFAPNSAWNTPVPASPVLDQGGRAMVNHLASGAHPGIANLYEFGVPIWEADATTKRYAVNCMHSWGTCQLEQEPVPVPAAAVPSSGSDAAMVVIDRSTGKAYEFWEARRNSSGWQAGWGGVVSINGSGTPGAAVGSGISRLAGVVRTSEVRQGRIDHALVFSTNNACRSVKRFPASKTDGASSRTDCIPEGARVQLDPAINVEALPGLTAGERMVARALQTYGAYAIDNGGANMAFVFETPSGESDPYPAVGFGWDYFGMDRIPWNRLRVLRQWDGR